MLSEDDTDACPSTSDAGASNGAAKRQRSAEDDCNGTAGAKPKSKAKRNGVTDTAVNAKREAPSQAPAPASKKRHMEVRNACSLRAACCA